MKGSSSSVKRARWSSRSTYILGAVGSAVGLGNLWRFPFLAFQHDGSSFLIPYIISLLGIGIPILFLEISLGRKFQGGIPYCMSFIHPRLVGIGWMSIFGTSIVTTYYSVIIAWILIFFFNSFNSPLPWGLLENGTGLDRLSDEFFTHTVLRDSGSPGRQVTVNPWLVDSLFLVWLFVYFAIYRGVTAVSKIVVYSVGLPIVLLWILLFSNVNREGAGQGVNEYIGNFNATIMFTFNVWGDSLTQVFFSIGLGSGTMTAYSSYLESKKGVLGDTLRIVFLDTFVSYFSGFAVFAILGALAHVLEVKFNDEAFREKISGDSLAFIAFPAGIAAIGHTPRAQIFSAMFFLTLFALGIDSQFAMVEAVITGIRDSKTFNTHRHELVAIIICVILFTFSIFFALDNGRYLVNIIDVIVNGYLMIGVGALECVAATWVYGLEESISVHGFQSMLAFSSIYLVGVLILPLLILRFPDSRGTIVMIWWVGSFLFAFASAIQLDISRSTTHYDIIFSGGASKLLRSVAMDEYDDLSKIPRWYNVLLHTWVILLKYFIPALLCMLIIISAEAKYTGNGSENNTDDGSAVVENVGKFVVILGWCIFFIFLLVDIETYSERTTADKEETEELLLDQEKQSSQLVKD